MKSARELVPFNWVRTFHIGAPEKKVAEPFQNYLVIHSKQWHVQSKQCELNNKNKNADKKNMNMTGGGPISK